MSNEGAPFVDNDYDEFWLASLFPQAKGLFSVYQKPISAIKADCLVGLDANVLLLPYELGSSSFSKIAEIYGRLARDKRLIVPAQAAREFVKNRAGKLRDLVKYINDQASLLNFSLHDQISFLGDEAEFKSIKAQSEEIEKARKKILEAAKALKNKIAENVGCDPVSVTYREVFDKAVYELDCTGEKENALRKDAIWRYNHRIPPGYKDKSKEDGGLGDLIIWKTILDQGAAQKKDIIFVTKDVKGDWWVQGQGAFQPRFELIEEYFRVTGGKTIHLISLSQLLETFDVAKEAVSDVRRAEDSAAQRTLEQNYLQKLATYSSKVGDSSSRFAGYSLAHLLSERIGLERQISDSHQLSRPIKIRLASPESLPEDELRLLLLQDRQLRQERAHLTRQIQEINREIWSRNPEPSSDEPA
jgi:hypothetical protein